MKAKFLNPKTTDPNKNPEIVWLDAVDNEAASLTRQERALPADDRERLIYERANGNIVIYAEQAHADVDACVIYAKGKVW